VSLHGELDHELLPPATAIWSLVAHEELSRPFSVTVTFPTTEPDVDLAGMLGKPITVRLFDPERLALPGGMRLFHGVVSQARFVHQRGDRFVHAVQIRPQLALLEHRVATRIFQDKSTFTIVKEVLTRAGLREDLFSFPDDPHPPRLFSLQWKESDLAFVSRLLEDEGIFYFTAHQTDGELTVFGDEDTVFKPISGDPTITLTERPSPLVTSDWITDVSLEARAAHDAYLARGWDCFTPQVPTEAKSGFPDPIAERYEFRRSFDFQIDATRKADRRLSALRARRIVLRGRSNSLRLTPGRTFDVDGAASPGANQSYRVLAAHTHFTSPEAAGGAARFRVDVEAMPAGTNYRPPLVTPRPRVYGKQSAVVVGDPGEEIHVDEWGRIRVRF
jgi:type VI secretion system secreted protein VgrG